MKVQNMSVPAMSFQRGEKLRKIIVALAGSLLFACNPLPAQDAPIPPLPGGGDTKPRELTPEELEARRKAHEAWLGQNLERFAPHLLKTVGQLAGASHLEGRFLTLDALLDQRREGDRKSLEKLIADERASQALLRDRAQQSGYQFHTDELFPIWGFDEYGPVMRVSDGLNAAKTIQTDKVWPGGGAGLNLDGLYSTIGMWDRQHPGTLHEAFTNGLGGTRVEIIDWYSAPADSSANHATRVAGVLAGLNAPSGSGATAKGMAYRANISAFNDISDVDEMKLHYDSNNLFMAVYVASGESGWSTYKATISSPTYSFWLGDIGLYGNTEDPSFGAYTTTSSNLDAVAYSRPYFLLSKTAGNERGPRGTPQVPLTNGYYVLTNFAQVFVTDTNLVADLVDGDDGGYDTLPREATAKNLLVVGSVADLPNGYQGTNSVILSDFSSYGPSDAGLIKPDIVANGEDVVAPVYIPEQSGHTNYNSDSGTSFAAPAVAASVSLLRQHFLATHTGWSNLLASTLKAIVIGTADEIGADGPDFKQGWGLMNTAKAAQLISSNAFNGAHIFELLLQTNQPFIGHFLVTDTNGLFKVTVAWTDPAAMLPAVGIDPTASVLRNDIDLRLISPSGQTVEPWVLDPDLTGKSATVRGQPAVRGDDDRNNVEQVSVRLPQAGIWKTVLTHKGTNLFGANGTNVTHQPVSLVAIGNAEIVSAPIEILDMAPVPGNQLAFLFSTEPGRWYDLQWINPVTASNWATIYAVNAQSDLTAITIALPSTNRFYRVFRSQ